jgi:hypothetical protein
LNLRPQRWKASALTAWPPKPLVTNCGYCCRRRWWWEKPCRID